MEDEENYGYKSKKRLAKHLGVTERTLHNYHKIVINSINDFVKDYPSLDGVPNTRCSLSPYQSWVIECFRNLLLRAPLSHLCDSCEGELFIKVIYVNLFSKEKYLSTSNKLRNAKNENS